MASSPNQRQLRAVHYGPWMDKISVSGLRSPHSVPAIHGAIALRAGALFDFGAAVTESVHESELIDAELPKVSIRASIPVGALQSTDVQRLVMTFGWLEKV